MKNKILITLFSLTVLTPLMAQEATYDIGSKRLVCKRGDITQQDTQAIVNAANAGLLGGMGVCGAIFKAAGAKKLQTACDEYKSGCPIGDARITNSCDLAKNGITHIIHAVGPDCRESDQAADKARLLKSAYTQSFNRAHENAIKSISFPFISSAIYAYPKKEAAEVAIDAILEQMHNDKSSIVEVRMVLFSEADYEIFIKRLKKLGISPVAQKLPVNNQNLDCRINKNSSSNVINKDDEKSSSALSKTLLTIGISTICATLLYQYLKKHKNKTAIE